MSKTVEKILQELKTLSPTDRDDLYLRLAEEDAAQLDEWDQQIERDFSSGGRGANLLKEIERQIAAGEFRPLDKICRK